MVFLGFVSALARAIHSLELIFRDTLAHGSSTGDTARNHLEEFVDIVGSGPFLMFEDFDAVL